VLGGFMERLIERVGEIDPPPVDDPETAALAMVAMVERFSFYSVIQIRPLDREAMLDTLATIPDGQRASGRHHIAHLQFINPADLERFAKLRVTGNFQPLWACKDDQNNRLTLPFVGLERANWQYRIASLLRLGTRVAFGSDWPVSSADPLQELHVAVNRVLSSRLGEPGTQETTVPLLPAEAIGVDAALDAFTRGVAYVNHEEDVAGTLELGKLADVAVLTQDIYTVPPTAIGDTTVALTVASGQIVHGDE